MATESRTIWKGAIAFGLVHIPVGLHTASVEQGVDFDWLDKRSMDPVGYKRINKRTGCEIERENIVKGVEYEKGRYAIITPEEIEAVYPRTTKTIEIQRFVDAGDIPFVYLERPYYVAPIDRSQKVYALLREVLVKTRKVALAKVVIATKQHLAVLAPAGAALVLDLLRWGDEVKPLEGLALPAAGAKGISAAEMKMAERLVDDMSGPWKPSEFEDEFRHAVMRIVERKVKAGDTETVLEPEEEPLQKSADVIDLTELLQRSLKGKAGGGGKRKANGASTAKGAKPSRKAAQPASGDGPKTKSGTKGKTGAKGASSAAPRSRAAA